MAGNGDNYAAKAAGTLFALGGLVMRYGVQATPVGAPNDDDPRPITTVSPTYQPPSYDGLNETLKIAIAVTAALLGTAIVATTAYCFWKHCKKDKSPENQALLARENNLQDRIANSAV